MTNKEDFQNRKRELLRKHKDAGNHMASMVVDMATEDALELIHSIFDVLRYTEPLGGESHKLNTKYAKDVVNLIYSYQNRYIAAFLIASNQEIRSLERAAEQEQSKIIRENYFNMQELGKKSFKFMQELLKRRQEEAEAAAAKKDSKERLDPTHEGGADTKI